MYVYHTYLQNIRNNLHYICIPRVVGCMYVHMRYSYIFLHIAFTSNI